MTLLLTVYDSYALPVDKLHELHLLLVVHNFLHHKNRLPIIFCYFFVLNSTIHLHNAQTRSDLCLYSVNTLFGLKFKGAQLWNSVPNSIKQSA